MIIRLSQTLFLTIIFIYSKDASALIQSLHDFQDISLNIIFLFYYLVNHSSSWLSSSILSGILCNLTSSNRAIFDLYNSFLTSNVTNKIWIPLLGRHGLVNDVLMQLGLIKAPVEWFLYSEFSVILALVHLYTYL